VHLARAHDDRARTLPAVDQAQILELPQRFADGIAGGTKLTAKLGLGREPVADGKNASGKCRTEMLDDAFLLAR
jgi:hypothetical protein